jgi:hypothetical protein
VATAYDKLIGTLPLAWDKRKADTFFRELQKRIAEMPTMQTDEGKELMERFFDAAATLVNGFATEASEL